MHIVLAFLVHVKSDFWPLDSSSVGPNILASIVWALIAALAGYVLWPRFRERINQWVQAHLRIHHATNVTPHHDAVLTILSRIEAAFHTLTNPSTTTKASPTMSLVSDLITEVEDRLATHPALTQIVADAQAKIHDASANFAREVLGVVAVVAPAQSREVSLALTALEDVVGWLDRHIARNQTVPVAVEVPAATPTPVEVPAPVDISAPPVVVPTVTGADSAAQTAVTPPAPPALAVTDPNLSATVGTVVSAVVPITGGTAPYTVTGATGTPPGLVFAADGTITGTPTTAGTFPVTVSVTDAATPTADLTTGTITIVVA